MGIFGIRKLRNEKLCKSSTVVTRLNLIKENLVKGILSITQPISFCGSLTASTPLERKYRNNSEASKIEFSVWDTLYNFRIRVADIEYHNYGELKLLRIRL